MSTWLDLSRSVVENHEKISFAANPAIIQRVLKAVNKAITHVWSKEDWTFKLREVAEFVYNASGSNTLPGDFLSFQGVGFVTLLNPDKTPKRELEYVPLGRMLRLLKDPGRQYGDPEVYSLGGSGNGGENQRSLYVYPIPRNEVTLYLAYQGIAPRGIQTTLPDGSPWVDPVTEDDPVVGENQFAWTEEIPCIPGNWHESVVEEVAILFRMMDKSADITGQSAIVGTALGEMRRDEPHGRENAPIMVPAYGWRMNVRYS